MTLDASGTVLVGRTAEGDSNVGHTFRQDGFSQKTRSGGLVADFNRLSSDGDICRFQKDGASVGIIGTNSGRFAIYGTDRGIRFTASELMPTNGSGTATDDILSVGHPSYRFKDLYLSGGVFLGGTGSANKISDYETGTWTPTNNGTSNVTIDNRGAKYTKIGQLVTVQLYIGITATSTSNCVIGGLPFAATSTTNEFAAGTINHNTSAGEGLCRIIYGNTQISVIYTNNNSKTWNQFNNSFIITTISYITDA